MQKSDFKALTLKLLGSLALGLALTACGGNDSSRLDGFDPGDDPSPGNGDSEGEVDGGRAQLGRGTGDEFVAGEIGVGIGADTSLSPGGRTSLDVSLIDSFGELITSPVSVSFNSDCISTGASNLIGTDEEGGSSVATSNGTATVTYLANGCVGEDPITARATYEGQSVGSARATIVVEADTIQTLSFVGASPEVINIRGAGGNETSLVTFRVLGSTGAPMRGVPVTFELTNTLGGIALVNSSDNSNANGEVSTTVQSGAIPTTVRVTARTAEVSTQSRQLAISTGIPDQNSMTLSATDPYPVAWNYNGVESQLTVHMADAFNNPPPAGTAVYFTTSGGSIEPECFTTNFGCSVTWSSSNPKPGKNEAQLFSVGITENEFGHAQSFSILCPAGMAECRHGRFKVLATALGNESFIDESGSGLYDGPPDIFATGGNCSPNVPKSSASVVTLNPDDIDSMSCDDLGEAYLDKNFNGERDVSEEYVDHNNDNQHTLADGIFNGILCSDSALAAGYCNRDTVTIREDIDMVMVCASPYLVDGNLPGHRDVVLGRGASTTIRMLLADCNGNGMPAGTTVALNDAQANDVSAEVFPDGALAGSSEPGVVTVGITANDSEDSAPGGVIFVTVTAPTPGGELTSTAAVIGISTPPPEPEPAQ